VGTAKAAYLSDAYVAFSQGALKIELPLAGTRVYKQALTLTGYAWVGTGEAP
jgi:hypothetical protein